jgi:hypothetical protein
MELLSNKRDLIPKSDLEASQTTIENPADDGENASIEEALTHIGSALTQVSQLLDELENNGMLGSAIRRFAADLADSVGNVARDLDHGEDRDTKRMWARAFLRDAEDQLLLENELNVKSSIIMSDHDNDDDDAGNQMIAAGGMTAARAISQISENDLVEAMDATRTILLDVEDALRNISEDDAEEIAEVGLAVAKIFLWGLQSMHSQIAPNLLKHGEVNTQFSTGVGVTSVDIEILNDDDDGDNETHDNFSDKTQREQCLTKEQKRLRILWPPIGDAVVSVASWGKDRAVENPILSIALAMTLWPAALIGAFIGGPIVAADWCLQKSYNALRDQSVVEAAEVSAANLYQVGKFYFLLSKLMLKQSVRVGKRQIRRRGGIEQVARDFGDWTIHRAMHPVESAGMLWNSAKWSVGKLVEGAKFVKDAATGNMMIPNHEKLNGLCYP